MLFKNEQSSYEELLKITPKVGAFVKTPECKGYVEEVNLITGKLKIKPEKTDVLFPAKLTLRVFKKKIKSIKYGIKVFCLLFFKIFFFYSLQN